jgi:hypothetical protein
LPEVIDEPAISLSETWSGLSHVCLSPLGVIKPANWSSFLSESWSLEVTSISRGIEGSSLSLELLLLLLSLTISLKV